MLFSRWLQTQLNKSDILNRLDRRLRNLEKTINEVKANTDRPKDAVIETKTRSGEPPIIIEYLNVEKIEVDRYEQSNNFGALGIKSLEGKLNIGANYGLSDNPPEEYKKAFNEQLKKNHTQFQNKKSHSENNNTSPKTTIRPRRPEDVS
ncbi:MAG: hypothetical protein ACO1OC_03720 [Tuberibacillus sp.]